MQKGAERYNFNQKKVELAVLTCHHNKDIQ